MLPSPDTMKGMPEAVTCIVESVQAGKPIFIHGDYDVDGITATALLTLFFQEIGIQAAAYIPNRLKEDYGLSIGSIGHLIAQGKGPSEGGVMITVDCGISAIDEVVYARKLGLRTIITDHHQPKEFLPAATAILNPKQKDCEFPFASLSGVGVAFFLIIALRKAFVANGIVALNKAPNLKKYLDLVALGTVADVVPLVGVNRILVRAGLEVLSAKQRYGVLCLCEYSGLADRRILSEDIAFKLAPRINASGRLGMPRIGLDLLCADTMGQAKLAACALEQMNSQRKQLELDVLTTVEGQCDEQAKEGAMGLAVYQENCHPGVLGILASRIMDRYCRPAILFTDDTTESSSRKLKGSGRSVAGVNLLQILEQCSPWIERFGGHAMAAGLTIKKSNFNDFMISFRQATAQYGMLLQQGKGVVIDYHFQNKADLTRDFARGLHLLQPFGEGNPEPKFFLSGEQVLQPREIKGHIAFQIQTNDHVFPGIGFRLAEANQYAQGPVDLVFQLKQSWFNGVGRDQVQALHFAPH
jgi:single-stranded-DNA-specific exonuclease